MGKDVDPIVIGYKYHVGMHMVFCHGKSDVINNLAVTEIRVADTPVWTGNLTDSGTLQITKPDVFGGDSREGGIEGIVDVMMGEPAQTKNAYLLGQLNDTPGYRGLLSFVLRSPYLGNVPRFKPWSATVRRSPAGWTGAPSSLIGQDANPAHILYELITSVDFGMGYPESRVDTDSFTAAAQTLATESFGLSLLWTQNQTIDDFANEVLRHIDGALYVDTNDGRWRLKLVRNDYVVADLPTLDPSNVIRLNKFSRPLWSELTNEVTVIYTDGEGAAPKWKNSDVSVHNLATLAGQLGQFNSQTRNYPGITNADLASKVASRDLLQLSHPFASIELTVTAGVNSIRPGAVYKFSWPDDGIENMVIRIAEVDYGKSHNSEISIKAVEDVFSLGAALYSPPAPTQWADPRTDPVAAPYRHLSEATYYQVARRLRDNATLLQGIDDVVGFLVTQAVRPAGDVFGYEVQVDNAGTYQKDGKDGQFCPSATAADNVSPTDTVFALENIIDLDLVEIDTWAYFGDEMVAVRGIDIINNTVTVDRGMIDTVPQDHPVGTRIFFGQTFESTSATEFLDTETVSVKLLTKTSRGTLSLGAAPIDQITFDHRFVRPYPPGKIRVNGLDYPDQVTGANILSWAHRDRVMQTAGLINQAADSIGPEPGTTYTVRIFDGDTQTLRRTVTNIAGTSYEYTEAQEVADGDVLGTITWQVEAVRDGYTSWQFQERTAELHGYGRSYGNDYGGIL